VFRGTTPFSLQNWISDANYDQVDWSAACPTCAIHKGFDDAFNDLKLGVEDLLNAKLTQLPNAQVIVAGQSLGGALADIYAYYLAKFKQPNKIVPTVWTFGGPRVFNPALADDFNSLIPTCWRVTNERDPVPHVPPQFVPNSNSEILHYKQAGLLVTCDGMACTEQPGKENDGKYFWNPTAHGKYLDVNYIPYLPPPVVTRDACKPGPMPAVDPSADPMKSVLAFADSQLQAIAANQDAIGPSNSAGPDGAAPAGGGDPGATAVALLQQHRTTHRLHRTRLGHRKISTRHAKHWKK